MKTRIRWGLSGFAYDGTSCSGETHCVGGPPRGRGFDHPEKQRFSASYAYALKQIGILYYAAAGSKENTAEDAKACKAKGQQKLRVYNMHTAWVWRHSKCFIYGYRGPLI